MSSSRATRPIRVHTRSSRSRSRSSSSSSSFIFQQIYNAHNLTKHNAWNIIRWWLSGECKAHLADNQKIVVVVVIVVVVDDLTDRCKLSDAGGGGANLRPLHLWHRRQQMVSLRVNATRHRRQDKYPAFMAHVVATLATQLLDSIWQEQSLWI